MKNKSRTKNAYFNSLIALFSQLLQVILGFVVRKIFIDYLGVNYLGYNSVFSNILQMLNLADMGIGVAITSFLYKPLADNDENRIIALMRIYKKLYSYIGLFVLIVGIVISFFLKILIPDANCSIWYLRILFYINLFGTVSSYFLAYKRTLLIADQKSYVTNIIDTIIYFIIIFLQLIFLIILPNYIIYLCLNVAKNIISNIIVSINTNKKYKYLKNKTNETLISEYKPQIIQYVKDVFISRIGAVIYYSTDNIILSVIKGSLLTGFLSNYTLLTGQLNTLVSQILGSLQATFGNFISTTEDRIAKMKMTDNYFCVNFCIGNFCFVCFSLLANDFVGLFFGNNLVLDLSTSIWLGVNLMLTFMIQLPSQVFIIYKLFKYDKPIIITSALLNIIISILLVKYMGLNGVLIGTFITSLIYLFSRFYIISKYVYEVNYFKYFSKIVYYLITSCISFIIVYFVASNISVFSVSAFLLKSVVIGILTILLTSLLLSFTKEFKFLVLKFIPNKIQKYFYKLLGLFIIISCLFGTLFTFNYVSEIASIKDIKYVNFSIDDSIQVFKNLYENDYNSIFDEPTFSYLKYLHDKYGAKFNLYVFYEIDNFSLNQLDSKYKNEFEQNSEWLKFGFHGLNPDSDYSDNDIKYDYDLTITSLKNVVGEKSLTNVIRLSFFKGSQNNLNYLRNSNYPIIGFFAADTDDREDYYLNSEQNIELFNKDIYYDKENDLYFYNTDLRIENISFSIKKYQVFQDDYLVIFTHEFELNGLNKYKIDYLLGILNKNKSIIYN